MNSLGKSVCQFWHSSIGKKIVVALTGILLVGFLAGHMTGNLLVFASRDAINEYGEFLHHLLHGAGIWIVRVGLLTCFLLHIVATISLTRQNKAARLEKYEMESTTTASRSSRIMIVSGLVVLVFVVFHIFHFTVRIIDPSLADLKDPGHPGRFDIFGMVVKGFSVPWVSLFYIVAITLLCSHLSHGIASIFQTLGLRSVKTRGAVRALSVGIALVLWAGFLAVPVSVLLGAVNDSNGAKEKSASPAQAVPAQSASSLESSNPPIQ